MAGDKRTREQIEQHDREFKANHRPVKVFYEQEIEIWIPKEIEDENINSYVLKEINHMLPQDTSITSIISQ